MRISEMYLHCLKNELGIIVFPLINMRSVMVKRQWQNYTPEERKKTCERMSKKRLITLENNSELIERMRKGMKKYWNNISPENKKIHSKSMSNGMKKAWENADDTFGSRLNAFSKRCLIEKDVPRINTYSGVITESQMEEINT